MENAEQEIAKLQSIVHQYTTFFIIFDIVFFITIILIILFAIQVLKSRRKLRSSNRYLRFTIKGQEEERARIARELHDTVAQDLRYCRSLSEKIPGEDGNQISRIQMLNSALQFQISLIQPSSAKSRI